MPLRSTMSALSSAARTSASQRPAIRLTMTDSIRALGTNHAGVISCFPRNRLGRVLVDLAVLHDDFEISLRIGNQVEILQGVPIHKQKVGKCPLFDHAEPAGIRIAKT